jgi:hypothetical protein
MRTRSKKSELREKTLVTTLKRSKQPLTIRELAHKLFPGVRPQERADSHVRNALRGPRANKSVKRVGRGTYKAR